MKLFGSGSKPVKVIDRIYMSDAAKWAAMADLVKTDPACTFIFWFDETRRLAEDDFNKAGLTADIFQAREISYHHVPGKKLIFGEHYPLAAKETELYEKLQLEEAVVYSSLTEPIFKKFGGEFIIELMHKLGMQENEMVEHKLISKSIRNAQEKMEKKIIIEQPANSAEDWFLRNV
jgi:hypothetical protein